MTNTPQIVLRYIGLVGGCFAILWAFTKFQFPWLLYTGFPLIILGAVYTTVNNWQTGKRLLVYIQLVVFLLAATYLLIHFS